jgi:hypothetical protein
MCRHLICTSSIAKGMREVRDFVSHKAYCNHQAHRFFTSSFPGSSGGATRAGMRAGVLDCCSSHRARERVLTCASLRCQRRRLSPPPCSAAAFRSADDPAPSEAFTQKQCGWLLLDEVRDHRWRVLRSSTGGAVAMMTVNAEVVEWGCQSHGPDCSTQIDDA